MSRLRFAPILSFAVLCSLCWSSRLSAGLDPEVKKPYTLRVVLHFAQHRLLTPVFQTQVEHELKDGLQAALGDLAQVDIKYEHPRLDEVLDHGLQRLDSWNWLDDAKTHFIFLDFVDGRYQIQARQYDGFVGLPSPVVRRSQVDDRQLVSRQAALMVDQDFGLAGTLSVTRPAGTEVPEGDVIEVWLKGGKLGAPLDHWIKKDDVLEVSQISDQGSRRHGQRVPWTLLQVSEEPKDGLCRCRLYFRHLDPLAMRRGVQGYRCIKVATKEGPVRLRLVSEDKRKPLAGRHILISPVGADPLDRQSTNADGLMPGPTQKYRNVAFVKIYEEGIALAQMPVEILDDSVITIPINNDPKMQQLGQLYRDRDRWVRHLFDSLEVAATVAKELNASTRSREETMTKAKSALKSIDADLFNAAQERDHIATEAKEILKKGQLRSIDSLLADGDQRLAELRERRRDLEQYIGKLGQIVKEEQDPKRRKLRETWENGRLLEKDAEFQQAINVYESVLQEYDDPNLREELNKLKEAWRERSDEHHKAHKFIYETWPNLQTAKQMKDNLPEAQKAFEICKKEHDSLRPQMLLKVNVKHLDKIAKELDTLRDTDDDKRTAEIIESLADKLKDLSDKISEYVRSARPTE